MTAEALRVALLSPCFWPEVRRGTERFTRELADGLLAAGHRPALITSHPGPPAVRTEDGLRVLRLPRPPQGPLRRRGYEPYMTHVPLSYAALRAGSYDLAHAMYAPDALAAARWKRRTGRPAVLSFMGIPDGPGLREYRRRRETLVRATAGCDAVVALSRHAANAFRQTLGYEATVIPPGVDLATFAPVPARAPVPTIICSADPLEPRKHVRLLIESFALVRQDQPSAVLILSAPRDRTALARHGIAADAPGLQWVDLDDRHALAHAYGHAWLAALPSSAEAFGLVIAEAMACGTPVVGYRDGAIPELIDRPEVGRLFDALEPDTLAQALLDGLALSQVSTTTAACRAQAEQYSTGRCTASYLALYAELLGRH